MKRKGFTLIELLAVIVILAVIALIATPMILGVIESSKKGAVESSALGYVKAVENHYVTKQLSGNSDYETEIPKLNNLVDTKGTKPTDGYIWLDGHHEINKGEFCINGYYVYYDGTKAKVDDTKTCSDIKKPVPGECTFGGELVEGAEYINGQYTYRYKQEYYYDPEYSEPIWKTSTEDGWGVALTDPTSTTPVTTKLCTKINGKPITSMRAMFYKSQASSIDLSSFDTSQVTDMGFMFYDSKATSLDLSNFDTSQVWRMDYMFSKSQAKTINVSSFDTRKTTSFRSMFARSQATILDLSSFDMSGITEDTYTRFMFYDSPATTGYARTQADADIMNRAYDKPATLNFIVKPA